MPRTPTTPAHLEITEPHAAIVRQIFAWHVDTGWSMRRIAHELTGRGIPTPKGGVLWSEPEVRRILHNAAYTGTWTVNRVRSGSEPGARAEPRSPSEWIPLTVPAVIDPETFQRSQQRHTENQRFSPRNLQAEPRWLLRGLARCGLCGHALITMRTPTGRHQQRFNYYYRCRHTRDTLTPCVGPYLRAQALDDLVWREVGQLLTHPVVLRQSIQEGVIVSESTAVIQTQWATVERQLATASRERARLLDAYQTGLLELADLQQRLHPLDLRVQQWEAEAARLAHLQQDAAAEEDLLRRLDRLAERVRHQLDPWDFAGRQALLRDVLDHVEATPEEVTLFLAIPLPPEGPSSPSSGPTVSSQLRLRQHRGATVSFPQGSGVCGCGVPAEAGAD